MEEKIDRRMSKNKIIRLFVVWFFLFFLFLCKRRKKKEGEKKSTMKNILKNIFSLLAFFFSSPNLTRKLNGEKKDKKPIHNILPLIKNILFL
jgi:glucan phosphoethanolaminetransferase (alkaline phosphatase superfamily)